MRTRDAAQCEDAIVTEPRNRLHGIETPGRPILDDFFMCYAHVTQTWARPDLEKPTSFEGWFDKNGTTVPTLAAPEDEGRDWDQACCELCSSCDAPLLAARELARRTVPSVRLDAARDTQNRHDVDDRSPAQHHSSRVRHAHEAGLRGMRQV